MNAPNRTGTLAARWILPVEGEPIPDGLLEMRDGRITAVGPRRGRRPDLDLGNVAITPGFVNAHTHLDLTPLPGDRPEPNLNNGGCEDEIDWLRALIAQRRRGPAERFEAAVSRNLAEAIAAGTTLIADITTAGRSWDAIAAAPIRAVVFAEVLGLKRGRGLETSHDAWEWIGSIRPEDQVAANARPGLSPHAPYSTAEWLYHRAASSRLPLTTHLAEMPDELELLETGDGRLREFLEEIDAWDDDWSPIGPRPADYIRRGELRRADWLIAHGTYLEPDDFWQLRAAAAPDGQRVAVAYCPRTTARFGHVSHPFRAMLERGVVVAIGTDSRASAASLSILDELRFLHRRDESLGGALLLTMATLFGAWALRAETVTGSIKVGKSADLAIIALPDRDDADPYRLLLDSNQPVVGTVFEGAFVAGKWCER